ncbi:unnamed protein product, partial [Discosporangium mesarthrocarpum]
WGWVDGGRPVVPDLCGVHVVVECAHRAAAGGERRGLHLHGGVRDAPRQAGAGEGGHDRDIPEAPRFHLQGEWLSLRGGGDLLVLGGCAMVEYM